MNTRSFARGDRSSIGGNGEPRAMPELVLISPRSPAAPLHDARALPRRIATFAHVTPRPRMQHCAEMLAESTRRLKDDRCDSQVHQMIARAGDILDELDEVLISLDPVRDGATFGLAAALHRDLEHAQALLSERRRAGLDGLPA